ncbi:MAG: pantetheine-phosphate adenylyltransferase [Alphaproteobacteria bacterium]|nr:pantetheine-phosphate adenylyltransferase [Alphaproteobacteria bacterium]
MRAVLAGSFDPITNGHLAIIQRGSRLFDEVIVACGHNVKKRYLLDLDVRLRVLRESTADLPNVRIQSFEGLLIDFCRQVEAEVILRGLRAISDFEFEFRNGLANMDMAPEVETVFLLTEPKNIFVSSSLVKEIATHGGDVSRYLPAPAHAAVLAAMGG